MTTVNEKIAGWVRWKTHSCEYEWTPSIPDYSNNIALAIEAVEKLVHVWSISFEYGDDIRCQLVIWKKEIILNKECEKPEAYYGHAKIPASALAEALAKAMEAK